MWSQSWSRSIWEYIQHPSSAHFLLPFSFVLSSGIPLLHSICLMIRLMMQIGSVRWSLWEIERASRLCEWNYVISTCHNTNFKRYSRHDRLLFYCVWWWVEFHQRKTLFFTLSLNKHVKPFLHSKKKNYCGIEIDWKKRTNFSHHSSIIIVKPVKPYWFDFTPRYGAEQ